MCEQKRDRPSTVHLVADVIVAKDELFTHAPQSAQVRGCFSRLHGPYKNSERPGPERRQASRFRTPAGQFSMALNRSPGTEGVVLLTQRVVGEVAV